jgi:RAD3-like DEAD/DEAH box helicase/helicase-like protein
VLDAKIHHQDLKMPQTQRVAHNSDNRHRRQRVLADQLVNDLAVLPERGTNPEWEALLDRLDVATEQADQTALIAEAIRTMYPYEGRGMQIESIRALIFDRRDVILIAKTSFGKSMIPQSVSALKRHTMTIMIIPLTELGKEQLQKIQSLPGCRPVLLAEEIFKKEKNRKEVFERLKRCEYTHILLSPEIAVEDEFGGIVSNPLFKSRVGLVVIDELHVVKQWGREFRKHYAQLSTLRLKLGWNVPWFGTSATLSENTLEIVKKSVAFKGNVRVIRTPVDRPEISIIIEPIKHRQTRSFEGLYFVLDKLIRDPDATSTEASGPGTEPTIPGTAPGNPITVPIPSRESHILLSALPKTLIYFESKTDITSALACIRTWLHNLGYSTETVIETAKSFHATTAQADKEAIMLEFRKEDSIYRVILATDALGMGVDLRGVTRVVVWKVPRQLDEAIEILWQRFGRAARGANEIGEAILLAQSWFWGPRELPEKPSTSDSPATLQPQGTAVTHVSQASRQSGTLSSPQLQATNEDAETGPAKVSKTDVMKRKELPEEVYRLFNSTDCIRKVILDHLGEDPGNRETPTYCCSRCHGLKRYVALPAKTSKRRGVLNSSEIAESVQKRLKLWRDETATDLFNDTVFGNVCLEAFLADEVINEVANGARDISLRQVEDLATEFHWDWFESHGQKLVDITMDAYNDISAKTASEVARKAAERNEKKAKTNSTKNAAKATASNPKDGSAKKRGRPKGSKNKPKNDVMIGLQTGSQGGVVRYPFVELVNNIIDLPVLDNLLEDTVIV